MPVLQAGDGSEYELIPENDQVNVMVEAVEENNFTYDGENVEKLRWKFTILDEGPWQGKTIQGDTSTNFTAHPSCKAYNWAVAITGHEFPPGTSFDTDELVGMRARALVGHRTSKQGRTFMKVKEVMPPRSATVAMQQESIVETHDPSRDGEKF
jgi:hypothetical protein